MSNELRKRGSFVSPSGVRSIWLRHELANFKQRLLADDESRDRVLGELGLNAAAPDA